MNKVLTRKHGKWLVRLIIAGCFILACIALMRKVQAAFLNYQVINMTAEMKDLKMKPMCVGRFLIDLPSDAEVSYRGAMVAGWSIATYEETDEQFTARLEEREIQLSGQKNERGMPSLESTRPFDKHGMHGKIRVFGRQWIPGLPHEPITEAIKAEAMIRVQKHSFNMSMKYVNDNDLQELTKLVTQFRSREENEIPTEAGFCFDGGFITEPLKVEQSERTTMFVGLNGYPDVSIALSTIAGITTPRTLLQRDADAPTINANRSRFHSLRRGARAFNGEPGEEILDRVHEFNGNYCHSFRWELVHNKTDNVFTPLMSFELSTGNSQPGTTVDSSLTDAHALALWEKMLSSLRVRPVVAAKTEAIAPAQAALGTRANSGIACPASGWWRGMDALAQDNSRWFQRGQILPKTSVQKQPSILDRLKGTPDLTNKPTVWEFVRMEDGTKDSPEPALGRDSTDKPA
ncbi:hypothetical protein RCH14_004707 [Massilia sp. MP_M2]|uniref:T6SS immunity protein Tli4 family protein n=1 Tax=Massilia sp. MP_M2 TaxID=3071713 RepID=UPI00319D8B7D